MATTDFNIGAIAKVDKDNRTHQTKTNQYILIVKLASGNKRADLEVFDNEAHARAAQAQVLGTGAGIGAVRGIIIWVPCPGK